jgi:hemerythrin-like metal-binding protein
MNKEISPEPYPWKKEYELKHELFDEQTKKFLEIINMMKQLVAKGVDDTGISDVFFHLTHYFERFMISEEIFLKELSYDQLEGHVKSHKEFMNRIVEFREGFELGKKDFHLDMYNYLELWFDDHMMVDDRRAVDYIKQQKPV